MSSSTRCVAHRSPTNHNSRRWIDFSSLDTLMQNVVVTSYNSHVASLTPGMTQCCIHGQIPCPWDIQHLQNRHYDHYLQSSNTVRRHDASCVGGDTILFWMHACTCSIYVTQVVLFPVTRRKQCILGKILGLLCCFFPSSWSLHTEKRNVGTQKLPIIVW